MSSNQENQTQTPIFKQEEEEEIDDFEEEEEDLEEDEEEEEDEFDSSDDPNKFSVTLALETPLLSTPTTTTTTPPPPPNGSATFVTPPPPPSSTDSRKLFQRLWTDEDEIGLLQGFLDFTTQRGTLNSSYHHETGPFYDHIKNRLQLDFNKNQLVEKLRRLKKKYRNVVSRVSSGKELVFKTTHDQITYEISRKIWSGGGSALDVEVEVEGSNHVNSSIGVVESKNELGSCDKKMTPRRRTTAQKREPEEDLLNLAEKKAKASSGIQDVIVDTMRSCLSPLIKELVSCVNSNGCGNLGFGFGGMGLNPLQLNFRGNSMGGETMDEKWRKQQILELEVYSKRIELVQEQIKSALGELRSMDSK